MSGRDVRAETITLSGRGAPAATKICRQTDREHAPAMHRLKHCAARFPRSQMAIALHDILSLRSSASTKALPLACLSLLCRLEVLLRAQGARTGVALQTIWTTSKQPARKAVEGSRPIWVATIAQGVHRRAAQDLLNTAISALTTSQCPAGCSHSARPGSLFSGPVLVTSYSASRICLVLTVLGPWHEQAASGGRAAWPSQRAARRQECSPGQALRQRPGPDSQFSGRPGVKPPGPAHAAGDQPILMVACLAPHTLSAVKPPGPANAAGDQPMLTGRSEGAVHTLCF